MSRQRVGRSLIDWWLLPMWSLAVAQPLLDLLGGSPTFFVAHRADFVDVVVFGLVVALGLGALVTLLPQSLLRFSPKLNDAYRGLLWVLLSSLVAAQVLARAFDMALVTHVVVGLGVGTLLGVCLSRLARANRSPRVAVAAATVPLVLFLVWQPVTRLAGSGVDSATQLRGGEYVSTVLIVFDEFPLVSMLGPDESVDAVRYPNFAELADSATWYRNATTVAQSTSFAVPAILSGRVPVIGDDKQPVLQDYPVNLFTLLGGAMRMNVIESTTRLCPHALCYGQDLSRERYSRLQAELKDSAAVYLHQIAPSNLEPRLPSVTHAWRDFWNTETLDERSVRDHKLKPKEPHLRFARLLEGMSAGELPTLHYLHVKIPHAPHKYLPSKHSYRIENRLPHGHRGGAWWGTEWEALQAEQRHLLQAVLADRLVGDLIRRLKSLELWEESLVVVTADHGASFQHGHRRRNMAKTNLVEIVNVPLFIKAPGQSAGRIDDGNVTTANALPGMLQHLGLEQPQELSTSPPATSIERLSDVKRTLATRRRRAVKAAIEYSQEDMVQQRRRFLEEKVARMDFGDVGALYAIGEHGALLGRPESSLDMEEAPASFQVRLRGAGGLSDVNLASAELPVHIYGTIADDSGGSGREALHLVALLNDVVAGTTETYEKLGERRFTLMLRPDLLVEGPNQLQLFEPVEVPGGWRFRPVEVHRQR